MSNPLSMTATTIVRQGLPFRSVYAPLRSIPATESVVGLRYAQSRRESEVESCPFAAVVHTAIEYSSGSSVRAKAPIIICTIFLCGGEPGGTLFEQGDGFLFVKEAAALPSNRLSACLESMLQQMSYSRSRGGFP